MKQLAIFLSAFIALGLAGCARQNTSPDERAANRNFPDISYKLTANPDTVYLNRMPTSPPTPQLATVVFDMHVTNGSKSDYVWTALPGEEVHVIIKSGDRLVWDGPIPTTSMNLSEILGAGQTKDYLVDWEIPDAKALPIGVLSVDATFTATGKKLSMTVPVRAAETSGQAAAN